jgi:streptogramin lyase
MNPAFREGSPAIHGRPTREGRIRKLVAFLALLILCWAASLPARAENRLALVIGEDTYEQIAPLRKAVGDARACASTLCEKGYDVSEGYDVKTFDLEAEVAAVVHAVGYSPDGRMLASGSADGVIGLLDATSGTTLATLSASGDKGVAYAPDGHFVTDADLRAVFQVVRGIEFLPMDDFIALDRRDSLLGGAANQNANKQ